MLESAKGSNLSRSKASHPARFGALFFTRSGFFASLHHHAAEYIHTSKNKATPGINFILYMNIAASLSVSPGSSLYHVVYKYISRSGV